MSIFELEQPAEQPIPELVAIIRQLLTDAESGEVRAFAYTSIHRVGPGDTRSAVGWFSPNQEYRLIGGLEVCKQHLLGEALANQDDTSPDVDR